MATAICVYNLQRMAAKGQKKGSFTREQVESGERFKEARRRAPRKLTQQAVADRLNVDRVTVANWETGKYLPDPALWPALCDLYDVSLKDLGLDRVPPARPRLERARPDTGRGEDPLQDALLGRLVELPLWPAVGQGVWERIEAADSTDFIRIPESLTQGLECVGLVVGDNDETLNRTALPGQIIVVGLRRIVPPGFWVVVENGNQVAVRGKGPDGSLHPIQPESKLPPLSPSDWRTIGIVLGVVKDVSTGRMHVDFELGGFRYR